MRNAGRLYRWVYIALVAGLVVSGALIVAGGAVHLVAEEELPQATLQPLDAALAAASGDGEGLASLGILSLMVTPAMVVAVAVLAASIERDWRTAGTGLVVFAIMALSSVVGRR